MTGEVKEQWRKDLNVATFADEIIDTLAPVHLSGECSDTVPGIGGFRGVREIPYCMRCALIELFKEYPSALEDKRLGIRLEIFKLKHEPGEACPQCGKATPGPNFCNHCGFDLR